MLGASGAWQVIEAIPDGPEVEVTVTAGMAEADGYHAAESSLEVSVTVGTVSSIWTVSVAALELIPAPLVLAQLI